MILNILPSTYSASGGGVTVFDESMFAKGSGMTVGNIWGELVDLGDGRAKARLHGWAEGVGSSGLFVKLPDGLIPAKDIRFKTNDSMSSYSGNGFQLNVRSKQLNGFANGGFYRFDGLEWLVR